jgi:hypothetical protein
MYVQHYIVEIFRNHCCYGNATIYYLRTVVGKDVTVSNTKVLIVIM